MWPLYVILVKLHSLEWRTLNFGDWVTLDNIFFNYRKTSGISRTKFQNLNVYCILLQLSSLNPLKPGVKLRMKM